MGKQADRARRKSERGYQPQGAFAALLRPRCSICHQPVRWMPYAEALDDFGVDRVHEFAENVAEVEDLSVEDAAALMDWWKCTASECEQRGAMGPMVQQ